MQGKFGLVAVFAVLPLAWIAPGARSNWDDTAVAIVVAAIGAATMVMDRRSSVGSLLAIAGCTWLFGNFVASSNDVLSSFGGRTLFLHRAVLATATLCVLGRLHRRTWWLLGAVYALALWPSGMRSSGGAMAWAALVIATGLFERAHRPNAGGIATAGAFVGGGTLAVAVAARWYGAQYRLGVVATATIAAIAAVLVARGRERLADAVTEHMSHEDVTVQAALAQALGDSSVEVMFAAGNGWIDEEGQPVGPPLASPGRHVTVVDHHGRPLAAIVHDVTLLEDPATVQAMMQAARLASEHVRLRSELRDATDEAIVSRRRVAAAASAARADFAADYRSGPGAALGAADRELAGSVHRGALTAIRAEVEELLDGLGPLASSGGRLVPALRSLAQHSAVRVELEIDGDIDSSGSTAETLWFVCAEGLSNVAKHSGCDCATVRVFRLGDGTAIEVADHGGGGAAISRGTGLQGLADRVAALGGSLEIKSSASGTRLTARVPDE